MGKIKKIVNGILVIGLMFCFFGGIVYAVAPDISIKILANPMQNYLSNINTGDAPVGISTKISGLSSEELESTSVIMAVYDETGKKYDCFSQGSNWIKDGSKKDVRYIGLPYDKVKNNYRLEVETYTNNQVTTLKKDFKIRYFQDIPETFNITNAIMLYDHSKIKLSWEPVEGATSYEVYLWPYSDFDSVNYLYEVKANSIEVNNPIKKNYICAFVVAKNDCLQLARSNFNYDWSYRDISPWPSSEPNQYSFKISGTVANNTIGRIKAEILGTGLWRSPYYSYFEIPFILENPKGYTFKISGEIYLPRYLKNIPLTSNVELNSNESPLVLWIGDLNQDEVINMADIMLLARSFNTTYPTTYPNNSEYNNLYDFNSDKTINLGDVMIIAQNFNKTSADYPEIIITPQQTNTPTPTITSTDTPTESK